MKFFHLLMTILIITGCRDNSQHPTLSGSAEKALSTFEIEPGFNIELIASEPLITDPVDMEIDEFGNLYVVEMKGVPFDRSGSGKIKLLTDTNRDGVMDKSVVFADSLLLPSGVMRWKKGILVTDPPNVLYLEDTDGDGRSDTRNIILTGFDSSNLESNINNPVYGLDNWIYLANGGTGSNDIHYADTPSSPRLPENAGGRTIRFRPELKELESLSSRTQFGHSFDAWGNYLLVNNSNHLFQEVIPSRYLERNPALLVSNATQTLSDHSSEVFPITNNPENQLLTDVGVFTAACGITAYAGGVFPGKYNDSTIFVAEPAHNIIHADKLKSNRASFTASRFRENKEFLASSDPWFRPVNTYVGPDGALYVVDFYRQFIEGPEFMSEEVVHGANFYNGTDKGRIYRITPAGTKPADWSKNIGLGNAATAQLVEKLAHPNLWWRQNAQRLLVDKKDKRAIPLLFKMAQNPTSSMGRLHALWTLEGMNALPEELIENALKDIHPGIRENGIKLAELHLNTAPFLTNVLLGLRNDRSPKVKYQLLCTLGCMDTPEVNTARQQLLFENIKDPWIQIAALTAVSSDNLNLLSATPDKFDTDVPAYSSFVERLSSTIGANVSTGLIHQLLVEITGKQLHNQGWNEAVMNGLAEGIANRKAASETFSSERMLLVQTALDHPSSTIRENSLRILKAIGLPGNGMTPKAKLKANAMAEDVKINAAQRVSAIDFLGLTDPKPYTSLLTGLINLREPLPVQLAALRTLSIIPDLTVSHFVLQQWPVLTPEIRDAALNTFMSNRERVGLLLNAIESGKIQGSIVGWPRSVTLMAARWPKADGFNSKDSLLQLQARKLLTRKNDTRKDVIRQYQESLQLTGNVLAGKKIFAQNCGICHQIRGKEGLAFGPDLSTIRNWLPVDIISNTLDPNQSIAARYDQWMVSLNNGTSLQGIISTETATAITLLDAEKIPKTIARKDIQSLTSSGISAMPEGLEKQINKQEMANLLAYLKSR